jgi:hypothetical protein
VAEPETVLEAVQLLERDGYTAPVKVLPDGTISCSVCTCTHTVDAALVDRVYRFEGTSDPDDEAIVVGLRCPHCGAKAALALPYGPNGDPLVLQQLQLLDERFREQ